MVDSQLLANGVIDEALLEAFRKVSREDFVPAARRKVAYADTPIEIVSGRWLLAPATFARLLQLAAITSSDRVLDVGCLTGYSTAVLAHLAERVIGLEQDAELVRSASEKLGQLRLLNAQVVQGRFADGHRTGVPFDVIVANGGMETQPTHLLAQLAEGGRLVGIVQQGVQGKAVVYLKENGQTGRRLAFDATAVVLNGMQERAGFVF